jgi:hypothetical protein
MNYFQVALILILIGLMTLGCFSILRKQKILIAKHSFADEYLNKFDKLSNQTPNQGMLGNQLYVWLTKNVDKMQQMLGVAGMVHYKPPAEWYVINDYEILINTLAQISNGTAEGDDIDFCSNLILRLVGALEERKKIINKNLQNPVMWFFEGVRVIITSPLYFLHSFGLLGSSTAEKLSESLFMRFVSGIIAIVGFLASIVQIFQGWDDVVKVLKTF